MSKDLTRTVALAMQKGVCDVRQYGPDWCCAIVQDSREYSGLTLILRIASLAAIQFSIMRMKP